MTERPIEHPQGESWEEALRHDIARDEEALRDIVLDLEFSIAVAQLKEHPGWARLISRMQQLVVDMTYTLQTVEVGPYRQGKLQGGIRVLSKLLNPKVLSIEEVDAQQSAATILKEQLASNRQELAR